MTSKERPYAIGQDWTEGSMDSTCTKIKACMQRHCMQPRRQIRTHAWSMRQAGGSYSPYGGYRNTKVIGTQCDLTADASHCVTYSFRVLVQARMQRGRGRSTQLHAFRYFSDLILPWI